MEKPVKKTRQTQTTFDKDKSAEELVNVHKQIAVLEADSKKIKTELMKNMQVGEQIAVEDYVVSRIQTETPEVTVSEAMKVLGKTDIFNVVKVSITELKKYMGEIEIKNIASKFQKKDYISVRQK